MADFAVSAVVAGTAGVSTVAADVAVDCTNAIGVIDTAAAVVAVLFLIAWSCVGSAIFCWISHQNHSIPHVVAHLDYVSGCCDCCCAVVGSPVAASAVVAFGTLMVVFHRCVVMVIQLVLRSAVGMVYVASAAEMLANGLVDRPADNSAERSADKLADRSMDGVAGVGQTGGNI